MQLRFCGGTAIPGEGFSSRTGVGRDYPVGDFSNARVSCIRDIKIAVGIDGNSLRSEQKSFVSRAAISPVAAIQKKLNISPLKAEIRADVEILQMLGPSRSDDVHLFDLVPLPG